jgi:hypothetical protein
MVAVELTTLLWWRCADDDHQNEGGGINHGDLFISLPHSLCRTGGRSRRAAHGRLRLRDAQTVLATLPLGRTHLAVSRVLFRSGDLVNYLAALRAGGCCFSRHGEAMALCDCDGSRAFAVPACNRHSDMGVVPLHL